MIKRVINRFFFDHAPHPVWLSAFRTGLGLVLCWNGLSIWADFDLLYGAGTLVDHRLISLGSDTALHDAVQAPLPRWLLAAYVLFAALLAVGRYPRIVAAVLAVLHHVIFVAHPAFSYGFDYLAASGLFYCVLFPTNAGHYLVPPGLRVVQLHLCIIYFFGGLDKLIGPTWRDGEAMWTVFQLPDLAGILQSPLAPLAEVPLLMAFMGWTVILLEIGYPVFIWLRISRGLWLGGIIAMHVGIALILGLYHFGAIMIMYNLCAFQFPYSPPRFLRKWRFLQRMDPPLWPEPDLRNVSRKQA